MPSDGNDNGNRPNGPQRNGDNGKPPVRLTRGAFSWIVFLGLGLVLLAMFSRNLAGAPEKPLSEFWKLLGNGQIEKIEIRDNESFVAVLVRENEQSPLPEKITVKHPGLTNEFMKFMATVEEVSSKASKSRRPDIEDKRSNSIWIALLVNWLPLILIMGLIWFFLIRQLRQSAGGAGMLGNFGRSRHKLSTKEHTHVTFADVAGIEEAKDEVLEIVEFLRNPKRFARLGGRIPRGVLLVGEPGCGKTLLAKAIAGEAEVPFFSISGSDFVEMFVGVGASRVRDLFRQAKENSPCIIFLDEIDAVGRRRGVGYNGGGHDEREQTLNAILVEMDGFDSNDQVIVIAATNRSDVLDPALVRPGRFDRQVFVPLPDVKGRYEILKVHAKKVKMQAPIEPKIQRLAKATPMFSGADLAAIINEAALLATLSGKDAVELEDLEEARDKIRFGRAKRSRVVDEKDRILTAYHEAGHAVVQSLLKDVDPVHKVSIIPRGPYGGATFSLPEKDRMTVSRSFLHNQLRVLCAGRIAEEFLGADVNSGAAGDIRQATGIARQMIMDWGMSDRLGFVHYGDDEHKQMFEMLGSKDFSEKTTEEIDAEVKRLIDEAYTDTQKMIHENRAMVESVAQALLKYETLDGEDVRALIAGKTLDKPTVSDLIEAERERRQNQGDPPMARPVERPTDGGIGPLPTPA
ncbi:MAG: ATP-dependent zinc metalloprotease FtsH [Phycisphaerae bacterium]